MKIPATLTGIDYSTTSPAACFYTPKKEGEPFLFEDCRFLFMTNIQKHLGKFLGGQIQGVRLDTNDFEDLIDRYDFISDTFIEQIDLKGSIEIGLEGYSMGSKGKVFNIGENTGILKYKLFLMERSVYSFAPTQIKMFACGKGKGNANKDVMYDAFVAETGVNLKKILKYDKKKSDSPVADIVDSYYVCKYLHYFGIKENI